MREYNGGLTREQFLFYEIRIMASLVSQGYTKAEAIEKITKAVIILAVNNSIAVSKKIIVLLKGKIKQVLGAVI